MALALGFGRRWCTAVVGASLVLLAIVPQAFGAAPWSAPQPIPGAYLARSEPGLKVVDGLLGFTPGGEGIAVLGRDAGGQGLARVSSSGTAFGGLRASRLGGVAASRMALFGREGIILGGQANGPGDSRSPTADPVVLLDAAVARGSASGGFARRQILAKGVYLGGFEPAAVTALATNSAGDAAAVVSAPVRGRIRVAGYESRLFVRRRGRPSFRKVADIGIRTVGKSPAALAVNGRGDVLVAWDDRTSVRARLITSGGRIGREQRLGKGGSAFYGNERLVASMDGTRRMLVAWMAQRVGEGSYAGGPGIVALAYASPHRAFRPAQVVQRNLPKGADRAIQGPAVRAALLRNRGVVVWTGYASGRYAVRTVDVTAGRAGRPRDLSPPAAGARLQGLALGPRGATIAAWYSGTKRTKPGPHAPLALQASARAADATTWGPIETITTTGPQDELAADAVIAANPLSGQTILLWSDPLSPALPPNPMSVRFSFRPAG